MLSLFGCIQLFVTPWTVCSPPGSSVHGFSRQEHWSGLPCPSPRDLPNPGTEPRSPALQADSLPPEPPGKPTIRCSKGEDLCVHGPRGYSCRLMHLAPVAIGGIWSRVPSLLFLCGSRRERELGLRALRPAQKPFYLRTWKWWLRWISLTTVPVILRLHKCLLSAWSFLSKFTFYSLTKLVSFVLQFTYGDEFLPCHFKGIFKGFATLPTDKCNTDETQELKCLLCLAAESSPCPWVILGRKIKTNKIISEKSLGLCALGTSPNFRAVCAWRLRVGGKGSCLVSFQVDWRVSCGEGRNDLGAPPSPSHPFLDFFSKSTSGKRN